MRVVVMGTPGAGKGTQAGLLAERSGAAHISTGDILREAVANGSTLGAEAQRYIDQGLLVPDEIVIGVVEERLSARDCEAGFILDGFPRTVDQARALDAMLARRGVPLDAALYIAVPEADALERLVGRRTCVQCGAMFHVLFGPPARPGRCDRCGGELVQREDDREETIRRRLDVYARQTAPVLDYYRAASLLREVAGTGSREDVFHRVAAAVPAGEGQR